MEGGAGGGGICGRFELPGELLALEAGLKTTLYSATADSGLVIDSWRVTAAPPLIRVTAAPPLLIPLLHQVGAEEGGVRVRCRRRVGRGCGRRWRREGCRHRLMCGWRGGRWRGCRRMSRPMGEVMCGCRWPVQHGGRRTTPVPAAIVVSASAAANQSNYRWREEHHLLPADGLRDRDGVVDAGEHILVGDKLVGVGQMLLGLMPLASTGGGGSGGGGGQSLERRGVVKRHLEGEPSGGLRRRLCAGGMGEQGEKSRQAGSGRRLCAGGGGGDESRQAGRRQAVSGRGGGLRAGRCRVCGWGGRGEHEKSIWHRTEGRVYALI